jgi:hypothetical protein
MISSLISNYPKGWSKRNLRRAITALALARLCSECSGSWDCVHINESSLQRRELGASLQIGERKSRVSGHVCKRDIRVYTKRKWGPNGCTCIRERE